jgi:hypothetical protein
MGLKTTIMVLLAAALAALLVFHFVTQDVTRGEYKRHHTIEKAGANRSSPLHCRYAAVARIQPRNIG